MTRGQRLERFILGYGLELPNMGEQGRPTSLGNLSVAAKEKCGDYSWDEILDALHNLRPEYAELKTYVYGAAGARCESFDRESPKWRDFLGGYFNITVLPAGRRHFEELSEKMEGDDRGFARLAIEEALKSVSEGDGRPRPKVGAVVAKDGHILSVAHRGEAPGNHAEYIALEKKLSDELVAGATVYTTLEPCTSRKHPKIPCAQRIIDRKVARVVIGMLDPNPDIRGLGDQLLSEAGIEVQLFPRELRAQVEEMNREFIRGQKQQQAVTKVNRSLDDPSIIAARSLCDATWELQKTAWSFYALHAQYGVARAVRDVADEESRLLQRLDAALTVFTQDYDLPSELSSVAKTELGNINIALVNLKTHCMAGRRSDMEIAATQIQDACERIRTAARPLAYRAAV
jgi:pyrimidine deaminase RibD-like protein